MTRALEFKFGPCTFMAREEYDPISVDFSIESIYNSSLLAIATAVEAVDLTADENTEVISYYSKKILSNLKSECDWESL
jgi:hypothetical protein